MKLDIILRDGSELEFQNVQNYSFINDYLEIYHENEITRVNEDQILYFTESK